MGTLQAMVGLLSLPTLQSLTLSFFQTTQSSEQHQNQLLSQLIMQRIYPPIGLVPPQRIHRDRWLNVGK